MFKHSCYIENSKEAREWLTSIGIRLNTYLRFELAKYIYFYNDTGIACFINDRDLSMMNTETTDCTGNLPLFKALTAVRDDNDYMQEFTDGINWVLCEAETVRVIALCHFINNDEKVLHKATKEELIEHFKK